MMVKLTKEEVVKACEYWLRSEARNSEGTERETTSTTPIAISRSMKIICTHTRSGVECKILPTRSTGDEA